MNSTVISESSKYVTTTIDTYSQDFSDGHENFD